MPKSNFDNFAFDEEAATKRMFDSIFSERAANAIPILDEMGVFTGETYDQRFEQAQNQPDPRRFQDYIGLMASQGQGLEVGQAPQARGFEEFNPVDLFESEGLTSSLKNIAKASLNESAAGMVFELITDNKIFPEMSQWQASELEEIAAGIGSLIADTPLFLTGGGLGSIAGKQLAQTISKQILKNVGKTTSKKALLTALSKAVKSVPTSAGAFGFHGGTVDALQQQLQTGGVDFSQVLAKTAEGAALGAIVGPIGAAVPGQIGKSILGEFGSKVAGKATRITGEIAAFGTAMPIIQEGRAPEKGDYLEAAKFVLGMQLAFGVIRSPFKLKDILRKSKEIETKVEGKGIPKTIEETRKAYNELLEIQKASIESGRTVSITEKKELKVAKKELKKAVQEATVEKEAKGFDKEFKEVTKEPELKKSTVELKKGAEPIKEVPQPPLKPSKVKVVTKELLVDTPRITGKSFTMNKNLEGNAFFNNLGNEIRVGDKVKLHFAGKPLELPTGEGILTKVTKDGSDLRISIKAPTSEILEFNPKFHDPILVEKVKLQPSKAVAPLEPSKVEPKGIAKAVSHKVSDTKLNKEMFGEVNREVEVAIIKVKSGKQVMRLNKASTTKELDVIKAHADKLKINLYVSDKMIKANRPSVKVFMETGRVQQTKNDKRGRFIVVDKPKDGKFERIVNDSNKLLKDC